MKFRRHSNGTVKSGKPDVTIDAKCSGILNVAVKLRPRDGTWTWFFGGVRSTTATANRQRRKLNAAASHNTTYQMKFPPQRSR